MWYLNKKTHLKWDVNEKDKDLIKRLDNDKDYEKSKPDYDIMTLNDLKTIAKDKDVDGYSTMKKDDLVAILKALDDEESKQK